MDHVVDIEAVDCQLVTIREQAIAAEREYAAELSAVDPRYRGSARNLVHYLALRRTDLRELQQDLVNLGLSSLGRSERNVLESIDAVRGTLRHGAARTASSRLPLTDPAARRNKESALGAGPPERQVSIMVTMPAEAATDESLVADMLGAGMNVARINCAHDDATAWARIFRNIRLASERSAKPCRIFMDLAGPKIRTGPVSAGPGVIHLAPHRDPMGRVIAPRRIRLIPDDLLWTGTKSAIVPVPRECTEFARPGDAIAFRDTRGRKRRLVVVAKDDKGIVAELFKGAYIASGTRFHLRRKEAGEKLDFCFGSLPPVEQPLWLRPGDTLFLTRDPEPGAPAIENDEGEVTQPAHISCRQPEVFDFVTAGDRVSLNDGKIAGIVKSVEPQHLAIEIDKAKPTGSRLRAGKGINFPESDIRLPGLTASDRDDLEFVVGHADAVGLSFVRRIDDVFALQGELDRRGATQVGMVIKIETREAFRNLPGLLLAGMRRFPFAVMIARGDLAVEAGWERLAELQEEVLWICEAARVPVIWATQVLERKAKSGMPSRAEISDAAMSQRADCVMLNKGPHIVAAIRMLDDILRRMQSHQHKKTATLRRLGFGGDPPGM